MRVKVSRPTRSWVIRSQRAHRSCIVCEIAGAHLEELPCEGILILREDGAEKGLPFQVRQQGRHRELRPSHSPARGCAPGPQDTEDDHAAEHAFIAHRGEINLGAIASTRIDAIMVSGNRRARWRHRLDTVRRRRQGHNVCLRRERQAVCLWEEGRGDYGAESFPSVDLRDGCILVHTVRTGRCRSRGTSAVRHRHPLSSKRHTSHARMRSPHGTRAPVRT